MLLPHVTARVATIKAATIGVALCVFLAAPVVSFAQGTGTTTGTGTATGTGQGTGPGTMPGHDTAQQPAAPDEYPRLKITGFADLTFNTTKYVDGPRGFNEGQFVLHMASALSPRVTFFGELSFTPRSDAGTGSPPATGFNAEVERMILRLDHSDRLKVSVGRYHTPISWWNTYFHHGSWLQTSISRPEMVQFGTRLMPIHFVGALAEGTVPAGGMNLTYQGGVGNGRSSVISRAGDPGDSNGTRAYLINAFLKPDAAYGLQAGGAYYHDLITLAAPDGRDFKERIYSGYAVWNKEDPEIIAEFSAIRHEQDIGGPVTWTYAYYFQAGYRLPQFNRLWKPYYRYEHIGVNPLDAVYLVNPVNNLQEGNTLGVRYDMSAFAALKVEYRNYLRVEGQPRNYGGFLQVCFTF
jgi:hypothetical protein